LNINGSLDKTELAVCLILMTHGSKTEKLMATFDYFDEDGSEFLDINELKNYLVSALKFEIVVNGTSKRALIRGDIAKKADAAVLDLFEKIDRNKDGKISLDEFALWLDHGNMEIINELNTTMMLRESKKDKSGISPGKSRGAMFFHDQAGIEEEPPFKSSLEEFEHQLGNPLAMEWSDDLDMRKRENHLIAPGEPAPRPRFVTKETFVQIDLKGSEIRKNDYYNGLVHLQVPESPHADTIIQAQSEPSAQINSKEDSPDSVRLIFA
jgi:Ca2+-binding EF-hand superfamily protein